MFIEKSLLLATIPSQVLPIYHDIVNVFMQVHARVYLVGGAVRDLLQSLHPHDIDIEVHGVTREQLETILARFGKVFYQGKSFGVFRLEGLPIDWALPRSDAAGRKPAVHIDPFMTIADALRRRDLTINAMAIDVVTGELIDPFGGYDDMQQGILAAPDTTLFVQDPLRFYRVMQFVGRFGFTPNDELNRVCAVMDLSTVSRERIHAEFDKLFLFSRFPSHDLRWLDSIGRLHEILPEIAQLKYIPQEKSSWHPEGSVFEHTMQACDAAAQRPVRDKKLLIYAALCHDLGKATTTRIIRGQWRSFNHEQAGVIPAKKVCARLTGHKKIASIVALLVRHHMAPRALAAQKSGAAAYKKLAHALAPYSSLYELAQLSYADTLARNGAGPCPLQQPVESLDFFIAQAEACGVLYHPEKPLITGHDILALGLQGAAVASLLRRAYDYQIKQRQCTRERILCYIKRMIH